jgi:pantetheine-phosphate adenylyltransferase
MNRRLRTDIETVFIAPAADSGFISASLVRQVLAAGGAVDAFVPPAVVARIGRTPTNGKDI